MFLFKILLFYENCKNYYMEEIKTNRKISNYPIRNKIKENKIIGKCNT